MLPLARYVFLALAALPALAAEGVVIVEQVDDLTRGVQRIRMIAVSPDGARLDHYQDGRKTTVIYNVHTETLSVVDHESRIYRQFNERDAKRMSKQLSSHAGDAEKQQDQRLRETNPEHRAHLEQLMRGERGGMGAAAADERKPLQFEGTAETDQVDDRPCTWIEARRDDQPVVRACVAPPKTFDLDAKELAPLAEAVRLMDRLSPGDALQHTLPARNRIPLRQTVYAQGLTLQTIEHQELRTQEIPEKIFNLPADYQVRQTFGFAF